MNKKIKDNFSLTFKISQTDASTLVRLILKFAVMDVSDFISKFIRKLYLYELNKKFSINIFLET